MTYRIIQTERYFDGSTYHPKGPYCLLIEDGNIFDIVSGDYAAITKQLPPAFKASDITVEKIAFVMPGLVEAHCHLFLDGGELDLQKRSAHMKASEQEMLHVARSNIDRNLAAGVTLIRDAGDRWGINHRMREETAAQAGVVPAVRSPGIGIRKPKRYGGFMGREVESSDEIITAIKDILTTGDELKILLTGIIDFATGTVKGLPQFDEAEATLIVNTAHELGRRTFAHCSGLAGLEIAAAAGIDSVEHGFFMTPDILAIMAEKQMAWVPTFSPVHFQWAEPDIIGWDEECVKNLELILESHSQHIALAFEMGVPVVVGSDAGSHGVPHGRAVIDEIRFLSNAGVPLAEALNAATSLPRKLWGNDQADIMPGNAAELIGLSQSPFENKDFSWQPRWALMGTDFKLLEAL